MHTPQSASNTSATSRLSIFLHRYQQARTHTYHVFQTLRLFSHRRSHSRKRPTSRLSARETQVTNSISQVSHFTSLSIANNKLHVLTSSSLQTVPFFKLPQTYPQTAQQLLIFSQCTRQKQHQLRETAQVSLSHFVADNKPVHIPISSSLYHMPFPTLLQPYPSTTHKPPLCSQDVHYKQHQPC